MEGWNCSSFVLDFAQAVKKSVCLFFKHIFVTISKECDKNGVIFSKEIK